MDWIGVSIIVVYQASRPSAGFWTIIYIVPYWALSIFLNIFVTLLIAARLFMMRKRMRQVLGEQHAKKYTSAIAVLVESAAIFSGMGLIYLIAYARRDTNVQNVVRPILISVMVSSLYTSVSLEPF